VDGLIQETDLEDLAKSYVMNLREVSAPREQMGPFTGCPLLLAITVVRVDQKRCVLRTCDDQG
jgi:hypothetical protein